MYVKSCMQHPWSKRKTYNDRVEVTAQLGVDWGQAAGLRVKVARESKIRTRGCELRGQNQNPLSTEHCGDNASHILPG